MLCRQENKSALRSVNNVHGIAAQVLKTSQINRTSAFAGNYSVVSLCIRRMVSRNEKLNINVDHVEDVSAVSIVNHLEMTRRGFPIWYIFNRADLPMASQSNETLMDSVIPGNYSVVSLCIRRMVSHNEKLSINVDHVEDVSALAIQCSPSSPNANIMSTRQ
jgi:hypothetical protein